MFLWILMMILIMLLGMGSIAFLTLLERKLLGLSQIRLGPNKVFYFGIIQPILDGVKLLLKELFFIMKSQMFLFLFCPLLLMLLFCLVWLNILPWLSTTVFIEMGSLFYFSILGLSAYSIILTGWSSSSAFSKLGGMRGMLQSLSFEVALLFLFLVVLIQMNKFMIKTEFFFVETNIIWMIIWLTVSLMETNRAPFDLLEGESELISGFNIEMGSTPFVLLFLSEYGMVIFMSLITSILIKEKVSLMTSLFFCFIIFMRSCFPRVRYDILMTMMWKGVLPISIFLYFFSVFLF